jgi:hypothetical protein
MLMFPSSSFRCVASGQTNNGLTTKGHGFWVAIGWVTMWGFGFLAHLTIGHGFIIVVGWVSTSPRFPIHIVIGHMFPTTTTNKGVCFVFCFQQK